MKTRRTTLLSIVTIGAAAAGLGACSSYPDDYSYEAASEIQDDPTPELDGLNRRGVDRDNAFAINADTNLRALNDDWDRFWFFDSPSRLSEFPHVRR